MNKLTRGMHNLLGIPQWTPAMPKAFKIKDDRGTVFHAAPVVSHTPLKVVYFPSCINQTMGLARKSPVEQALVNKMVALLHKAGYEVIYPKTWKNYVAVPFGKVKVCWTLPTVRHASWKTPYGKPVNKVATPYCATKAHVCTACARPSTG